MNAMCRCSRPIAITDGQFEGYCGQCGKTLRAVVWAQAKTRRANEGVRSIVPTPNENVGTSTAPEEAGLREIGRTLFGIRYPEDE
jgi:hypothetical protein